MHFSNNSVTITVDNPVDDVEKYAILQFDTAVYSQSVNILKNYDEAIKNAEQLLKKLCVLDSRLKIILLRVRPRGRHLHSYRNRCRHRG